MVSSVPQFIDVEDKIAGPLTWRQLGWMIAMGVTIFVLWVFLGKTLTIVASIPTVLLFLLLAFYRPNGFPMSAFIGQAAFFLFRPKMAVWERPIMPMVVAKQATTQESVMTKQNKRHPTQEKFRELARIIDSQGSEEEMRDKR